MTFSLPDNAQGILPSQALAEAVKYGVIETEHGDIGHESIQPASIDLHLSDIAYRLRCSFSPNSRTIQERLARFKMGEISLEGDGGILEQGRFYLIPLRERVQLPAVLRGKANPKSSTGRLDIFARVVTDLGVSYDEIPAGYHGKLYLLVKSQSFTVQMKAGLALNQLRLAVGQTTLADSEIHRLHSEFPLLYRGGQPVPLEQLRIEDGLLLGAHVGRGRGGARIGWRAKENSQMIDCSKIAYYQPRTFWEEVTNEVGAQVVLDTGKFYLILSDENIRVPPDYAAEMIAMDPGIGEVRTHYAGFFDPGFGHDPTGLTPGSKAALEVRAHESWAVEHGQKICRLKFERMLDVPDRLYGASIGSNYQSQESPLSKHFRRNSIPIGQETLL